MSWLYTAKICFNVSQLSIKMQKEIEEEDDINWDNFDNKEDVDAFVSRQEVVSQI